MPIEVWSILIIGVKVINYAAVFLSAGSVLFSLLLRPNAQLVPTYIFLSASIVAIISSLLLVPLNIGMLNDNGFIGMFHGDLFFIIDEGPLGQSNQTKIAGLCMLIATTFIASKWTKIINIIGICLIAWSFGQIGHAQENQGYLGNVLIAAHILAVMFWMGALLPLYRAISGQMDLLSNADLAHRFGQLALLAVPLLMIVGGVFSYQLSGSFTALISSTYGQVLGLKIALVCSILIFAAINKFRIVPDMFAKDQSAVARLKKSIFFEALFACLVLITTASLTTLVAPHAH